MSSTRLSQFFAHGAWGFKGGRRPQRQGRPFVRVLQTLGFLALALAPRVAGATTSTEVLAPLIMPPPRPTYTQDQQNDWYFDGWDLSVANPTGFTAFIAKMNERFGSIDPDRRILVLDPDMIFGANAIASAAATITTLSTA